MTPSLAPRSAGQMTAALRAAAAEEPRARHLRVALVQGGRVIEERLVAPGAEVTIGCDERCTLVAPAGSPERHRLFAASGGEHHLSPPPGTTGRVALAGGTIDLSSGDPPGRSPIPLGTSARGRLVLPGEVTVLFQLVVPPPAPSGRDLPAELRGGLRDGVDWTTTIIGGLSFLLHFGAVGSLYADWMDPVIDYDLSARITAEAVRDLPRPITVEAPPEAQGATAPPASPTTAPAAAPAAAGERGRTAGAATGGPSSAERAADARAAAIAAELDAFDVAMTGALGAGGRSSDRVLRDGDVPTGLLEGIAASPGGVRREGGLRLGDGGGVVRPGQRIDPSLPGPLGPPGPVTTGTVAAPRPPPKNPQIATAPPDVAGSLPGAEAVIAGLRGPFRNCYRRGLEREDPTMRGTVRLTVRVGPNGEVLSTSQGSTGTLSATVIGCIAGRMAGAQFAAPPGGGAVLRVPITLLPGE